MNQEQDQQPVQVETVKTFPTTSGEPVGQSFARRNAHRNDEPPFRGEVHPDDPDGNLSLDHLGRRGD